MRNAPTILATALLLGAGPRPGRAEECRCIVMVYSVCNPGTEPAGGVRLHCLVPQNIANQQILRIVHDPPPQRFETDRWGQRIAVHSLGSIPPRAGATVKMIVWARWADKRVEIDPAKVGPREAVPDEVRRLYLCNRTKYQITSPVIQKNVSEETAPGQNMAEAARALHRFVSERVHFDMDGEWDDAVTVLRRGTGSCSEFTFALIALCRAAGIPARYVGGTRQRVGPQAGVDLWNHRWPEVYLPNYGWVPADRDMFGTWRRNALILACGDGGDDTPIGWNYTFGWTADKGCPHAWFRAYWNTSSGPDADEKVVFAAAGLRSTSQAERLSAVAALGSSGKRLAVPFLADGLYFADAKVFAAVLDAIPGIGGRAAEVALVDALGRRGGAADDAEIVAALRQVSGRNLATAAEWASWLHQRKTHTGLRIRAFVDGRSKLVLTRSSAQWVHYSGTPPGLGDGRNEPTFLENYIWKPRWARREKTYGGENRSEPLRLKWPFPGDEYTAVLEAREACGEARLLETSRGAVSVLFQNTTGKPGWFDVLLRFERK